MASMQSGDFPAVNDAVEDAAQDPHPSFPFAEQTFAEQHTVEGNPADRYPLPTFREPTPSLSFGEPVGDPSPSGSFREPHPSFPTAARDEPTVGPRAPYPSTSRPRHSLSADSQPPQLRPLLAGIARSASDTSQ